MDRNALLMNRRTFLTISAAAVPGALLAPASAVTTSPVYGAPAPFPIKAVVSGLIAAAEFIAKLPDAVKAASEIYQLIAGEPDAASKVTPVHNAMSAKSYTGLTGSPVYKIASQGRILYAVGHTDGLNAILPFYDAGFNLRAIAEAPAIVAMALLAGDWPTSIAGPAHEWLIPQDAYMVDKNDRIVHQVTLLQRLSPFERSWDAPVGFVNGNRMLAIDYVPTAALRQGTIAVKALRNESTLFTRNYPITW
jgi:hypothetical protein